MYFSIHSYGNWKARNMFTCLICDPTVVYCVKVFFSKNGPFISVNLYLQGCVNLRCKIDFFNIVLVSKETTTILLFSGVLFFVLLLLV